MTHVAIDGPNIPCYNHCQTTIPHLDIYPIGARFVSAKPLKFDSGTVGNAKLQQPTPITGDDPTSTANMQVSRNSESWKIARASYWFTPTMTLFNVRMTVLYLRATAELGEWYVRYIYI